MVPRRSNYSSMLFCLVATEWKDSGPTHLDGVCRSVAASAKWDRTKIFPTNPKHVPLGRVAKAEREFSRFPGFGHFLKAKVVRMKVGRNAFMGLIDL